MFTNLQHCAASQVTDNALLIASVIFTPPCVLAISGSRHFPVHAIEIFSQFTHCAWTTDGDFSSLIGACQNVWKVPVVGSRVYVFPAQSFATAGASLWFNASIVYAFCIAHACSAYGTNSGGIDFNISLFISPFGHISN